ncbi:MAG: hypothetical protein ACM319_00610 [Deltaproteobacteria bacterium]|nr:hypothetical protein [Candidatus Deferrimicrobiaceae bacterium]
MKTFLVGALLAVLLMQPTAGFCGGDLDSFIANLNVQARADLPGFKVRLSAQFGIPLPQVETVIAEVRTPGDAYMVMRVGQVARQPQDVVLNEYQANKGKGWGVIAKNLGIKPGSREFHELKKGFDDGGSGKGQGKGKGKGKGHSK